MARTLPTKTVFVLNAIGITAAIALISEQFQFTPSALSQVPSASLSQVHLPFFELSEAYPARK